MKFKDSVIFFKTKSIKKIAYISFNNQTYDMK